MDYLNIILVLVVGGLLVALVKMYFEKKETEGEVKLIEKEKSESEELGKSLVEYNQKMQERKTQAKEQIMEMFALKQAQGKKAEVSNREAAKKLEVSRSTIARYFDELEQEEKVKQVGKTGQNVIYRAIK